MKSIIKIIFNSQVTFTVMHFHEILKSTKSLASTMVTVTCLGKICVHVFYQNKIKAFIEEIDDFIGHRKRESANLFVKIEKRMDKMFRFYNYFCWFNAVVYGIIPALYQTYMFATGKASDDIFVMPFDTEYFFDSSKTGVYQICYFNGFVSLLFTVQWVICVDSLFLGSCYYIGEL
jgi:7tm Odorant receptor